jgi:hypothetical protein
MAKARIVTAGADSLTDASHRADSTESKGD